VGCAPKLEQEMAAMQSSARQSQVGDKISAVDWTKGVDAEHRRVALCPHCGAEASHSGKFCPECGQPLTTPATCAKCGAEVAAWDEVLSRMRDLAGVLNAPAADRRMAQ